MDIQVLKEIALFLNPILLAVCAYFLISLHSDWRRDKTDREKKTALQDAKISGIERELLTFKADLPKQYVLKDDFIRVISVFESKLDEANKNLIKLVKRENGSES